MMNLLQPTSRPEAERRMNGPRIFCSLRRMISWQQALPVCVSTQFVGGRTTEYSMFDNVRKRRQRRSQPNLTHLDAQVLRQMGLNPDDFRDALEGRRSSVLFTPFRHPHG